MSGVHDNAVEALQNLLAELPAEFSSDPEETEPRSQFSVIKKRNVKTVHRSLWELQNYFGLVED
jgi:hypothetical protein